MNSQDKWTYRYLIAAPSQDPYLLIDFKNENTVLLFDCGVRVWGKVRTLLKLRYLFITHAHIDHLIGFDHILRALLGENKRITIYGPPGIRERIQAKLTGYDWDRAADQQLVLEVVELVGRTRISQVHECCRRFEITEGPIEKPWDGVALKTAGFTVQAVETDHGGSPCLAYSLVEANHLRIRKDRMAELGLHPGPWVGQLLRHVEIGGPADAQLEIKGQAVPLEWLKSEIVWLQKGRKVSYVTDTVFTAEVLGRVAEMARNSDVLCCESTFMEEDAELAKRYHHLTARQAATIAGAAGVRRLVLFHISNRYFPNLARVLNEAREVFPATELAGGFNRQRHHAQRHHPDNE